MKANKFDTDKAVHDEAMQRFSDCIGREGPSRRRAVMDRIFVAEDGGQWADELSNNDGIFGDTNTDNTEDERPKFEVNMVAAEISRIVGEQRKIDIGPKIVPMAGADKGTADTLRGVIRNIEKVSKARDAYDNAFQEILQGGYGGIAVTTQYVDNDVFDQEIKIQKVLDATTSMLFGPAIEYDKSDAAFAFMLYTMDRSTFKATYPDADPIDFDQLTLSSMGDSADWFGDDDTVRMAVYWRKVSIKRTIVQFSDGRIEDLADVKDVIDELAQGKPIIDPNTGQPAIDPATGMPQVDPASVVTIVNQRETDSYKIERYVLNGAEVVEEQLDYAGRYIPLIPVFGEQSYISGHEVVHGKVRFAKDPSRMFNFMMSAEIERFAMSPGAFHWATPEQIDGHEDDLKDMNTSRAPIQQYNPITDDNGNVIDPSPPKQSAGPILQPGVQQFAADLRSSVFATMGSAGQVNTTTSAIDRRSGNAIAESGAMIDSGSYLYVDNLFKSIEHCYRVIVDLAPHIMDTAQQVNSIRPDGTSEMVEINTVVKDQQTGRDVMVNDLSLGRYGVDIATGPSFSSQRAEASEGLIKILELMPNLVNDASDILLGLQDTTGSEELAKRVKEAKIRKGELVPTQEEAEEMGIERDKAIIDNARPQIEQELMASDQAKLMKAQVAALEGQAQESQARAQTQGSTAQLNVKKGEAEIIKAQAQLVKEKAQAGKTQADIRLIDTNVNKASVEANNAYLDGLIKKAIDLGIPLTVIDDDNRMGQEDLIELSQMVIDPQLNSNQQAGQAQISNLEQMIGARHQATNDYTFDPQTGSINANR